MAERTNLAVQPAQTEPNDRNAQAIRQDIAAKRESISDTVDKLGERIHESFDWREYVAEYPGVVLGVAAGAGFLIAGIFKRRPTPQERILDAVADLTEEMTDRAGDVMLGVMKRKLMSGGTLKAAASAMIAKAAVGFVKSKLSTAMSGDDSRSFGRATQGNAARNLDTNVQPTQSSIGRLSRG